MSAAKRQLNMWEMPDAAIVGEFLDRLAKWCDAQKGVITFSLQRSSTQMIKRGHREFSRGWVLDIRRRGAVASSMTAASLTELARMGSLWIEEQQGRGAK